MELDKEKIQALQDEVENNTRSSCMQKGSDRLKSQHRLWRVANRLQTLRWNDMINAVVQDPGAALLCVYMSDGWGCDMSENIPLDLGFAGKPPVRREVRQRAEWFLEKAI